MRILSVLLALGALAVAGCGGDDDNGGSNGSASSTPAATTPAATTPAAPSGNKVTIHMKNIQFDPASATAKVGQTVEWVNDDTVDHNVKADSGEDFTSKNFGKGGTYSYKLDKPGTIKYECTIHPGMTGTLTVTQ